MPITWYVARGGGAVATDASETYGVSAAVGLAELCEAISTGGELLVADSAVGVSVVVGLAVPCKPISIGGEPLVADSAVAGVGDAATDGVFGSCVTPRITKTSTTPVNSASVPKESCFAREAGRACVGSGGGTMVRRGGAPHEGQAVADELISLPHS